MLQEQPKKRHSYDAKFKRKVIMYSDEHGNRAAGRKFNVDESMVRRWRLNRTSLFKCDSGLKARRGKPALFPELEEEVANFVKEKRKGALPVTYDIIRTKALAVAQRMKISRRCFKASLKWTQNFMKRNGFSLRRRTSIFQKLPRDYDQQLLRFQRYIIALRSRENFLLGQIGNADETPVWFDMPSNSTIEATGSRQVLLKSTGAEKQRFTVMLGATADGRKLPPFLIFKRKTVPTPKKNEGFPHGILVRAQEKGWMDEGLMIDWIKNMWGKRPGALLNLRSILVLDAFRGHLTPKVKALLKQMNTELVIIPGGMTSVLQPMDVSINKPVKTELRKEYNEWIARDDLPKTKVGKIQRASPFTVAGWVKKAWDRVSKDVISRAFKKCCISNVLDGTEDDMIWEPSDDDFNDEDYEENEDSHSDSGDNTSSDEEEESEQDVIEEHETDEDN